MSLANSVRIRYEVLRELDWTAITANYVAVGGPVLNPIRIIKWTNGTDSSLLYSLNGFEPHDIFPKNTYFVCDYGSNKSNQGGYLEVPAGERLYVKAEAALPTYGKFYITIMYVSNV